MIISDSSHTGFQQTDNGVIEKYCYDNDINNCDTYGGLYGWDEAMQYVTTEGVQGICPSGWHIPTKTEYETLQSYIGDQATKLIDESQAINDYTYTNETGFSALFAGYRDYHGGSFSNLGDVTYFWSSTENSIFASFIGLSTGNPYVDFNQINKNYGFSIRCLKD